MSSQSLNDNRIPALCALIEMMTSVSVATPPFAETKTNLWAVTPPLVPAPPDLQGNSAQLAIDAAGSATAIAQAVALLGDGNDQKQAMIIWTETLNQMERIQALYHLPALPFQSQPLPPGAS